jgi:NAD+ kinase
MRFLGERGLQLRLSHDTARLVEGTQGFDAAALGEHCDLAIVIGADGTLLHTARALVDFGIPLLGINLGRLGFLADVSPDAMCDMLGAILDGQYQREERMLLECHIGEQPAQLALNDVVLHKWNIARMLEFETWVNASLIDTQRSDGIIVSTPTGSTAYALSGGGPLLSPELNAIALVPICPHTLSNRPIVVHGESEIRFRVAGQTEPEHVRISCDGQTVLAIHPGEDVRIRRHARTLHLLHPAGHDHFQILRTKLGWGEALS